MPMTPTVRLKFLSIYMREARLQAGVDMKDAAKLLGRDTTRVTKMEKGREGLTPGDAKMLLDHYDVHSEEQKAAIVELARTRSQRGRWSGHRAAVPLQQRAYYDFECDANLIQHYGAEMVPGLLQTESYMRAMLGHDFRRDTINIEDVVAARLERQEVLFRQRPATADFILSESCLRRMAGGNAVMNEQLKHLVAISRKPNIQLQILPFDAPGGGNTFGFTMLRIPAPTASAQPLEMVYVENLHDADYLDGVAETADYAKLWSRLTANASGIDKSRRLILEIAQNYA
ncbi:helix-turn-helix transcriptional regulator [Amycolatopsis sp. NPDC051102]|uniref:helix-turn-helix domain-containing protein n=1 Tax=Amycolatopsis sp. NPDC051102 TaxID=3155163 RepID=UPI0034180DF7